MCTHGLFTYHIYRWNGKAVIQNEEWLTLSVWNTPSFHFISFLFSSKKGKGGRKICYPRKGYILLQFYSHPLRGFAETWTIHLRPMSSIKSRTIEARSLTNPYKMQSLFKFLSVDQSLIFYPFCFLCIWPRSWLH